MPDHVDPHLDHIVLAAPNLSEAVAEFTDLTGVEPAPGGRHRGWGTANYLVRLGGAAYLEIIGPDVDQPAPNGPRPFRVDELTSPTVVTWAVHPDDLDATVASARSRGHDPGPAAAMSRETADGDRLEWRLTPTNERNSGLVPFLIDWGRTPHPTTRIGPITRLVSFTGTHPRPDEITEPLAAVGVELDVTAGDRPALSVVLDTPHGPVTL
jgi:hypothetical protein